MLTRRSFLGQAAAASVVLSGFAHADPLGLPLGLQLYSVRKELAADYAGTLDQLSGLGYREVEAAGFYQKPAAEVKEAMRKASLRCVSAHYPFSQLQGGFDDILAFNHELGTQYIICSSPGFRASSGPGQGRAMTLDDWHFNADRFNEMGAKTAAAGMHFGYHNHVHEFAPTEGVVPYLDLLRLTDPAKITMELDCGWAFVAGMKPVALLREYPNRFSMLHVKDFKVVPGTTISPEHEPTVTELGMGSLDYRPIFQQAAKTQMIKHMFIEQEAFDMPYLQSLKIDAEYMKRLSV